MGLRLDFIVYSRLYLIEITDKNLAVELGPDYLLGVASHHTTAWGEVHWIIHQWGLYEWDVWSIHSTGFEEVISTETNQDGVFNHVWVLVDLETTCEVTNLAYTHCELGAVTIGVDNEAWD